jgi:hypothetical protein
VTERIPDQFAVKGSGALQVSLEIAELEARHILKALHLPEDI